MTFVFRRLTHGHTTEAALVFRLPAVRRERLALIESQGPSRLFAQRMIAIFVLRTGACSHG